MRPTFREMADSQMSELKFTDEMKLSVLVRGRRRRSFSKRLVMAVACLLIMCIGAGALLYALPDSTPDKVVSRGSTDPVVPVNSHSSENFDIVINRFDHDGMYVHISFTLTSRAEYDALVIRNKFHDDDIYIQNQLTITETSFEPAFPSFAEQAIYLPAGERLSFDATVSLADWLPGEEALLSIRFDFLDPATEPVPEDRLALTDGPLLIQLDETHVDIARAVTQKEDLSVTVTQESLQLNVRDWPSDLWIYTSDYSRDYPTIPSWLMHDGVTADEGEKIELAFSLTNVPETLTVMCEESVYPHNAAEIFSIKYPDIQLLRVDPDSYYKADIVITNTFYSDYVDAIETEEYLACASYALYDSFERMYPSIRRAVCLPGDYIPVVQPLNIGLETVLGYNPSGFAQLGLTDDDVPETWLELLQLLQTLPEYNLSGYFVSAFPWQMSVDEVKRTVFDNMIYACAIEMAREGMEFDPDHHYIRRLMLEFEQIDFEALCLPGGSAVSGSGVYLFGRHAVISPSHNDYAASLRPMPLALFNNFEPVVNGSMLVGYVRSGCDSYSYASEYLELLIENVDEEYSGKYSAEFHEDYVLKQEDADYITAESLTWYRSYMDYMELTPATLDPETSNYLYDEYFYSDD